MPPMAPEGQVRWGVIGTGAIARAWSDDLRRTDSGRIVAVGSRTQAAADRFGDDFDVPARYASYEELVADDDVDAVYVTTPHPWHHDNSILALEAGKPVLCEKPLTMNAAEARAMVAMARDRKLFLMEAMWTRFLPHIIELRRLLADGAIGDIIRVSADHGQAIPHDPAHRIFAPELGGGALLDLGVYPVSFASMLLGTPSKILAAIEPAFTGVDGQTSMLFVYPNGAQALLSCTSLGRSPTRADIVGTQARIEIDTDFYRPSSFTLITASGERTRFEPPHEGWGLRHQADEVARCLHEGLLESPVMPLDESISIMETMDTVLSTAVVTG
jgi:predicted dehydrogenase